MTTTTPKLNPKNNPANYLLISLTSWFRAFAYVITHPWTLKYYFLAVFINIIIFFVLIILAWATADSINQNLQNWFLADISISLIKNLIQIFFAVITFYLYLQFYNILSAIANSPIYSSMTSKFMKIELDIQLEDTGNLISDSYGAIKFEVQKLILWAILLLILFLFNFIPFIGTVIYLVLSTSISLLLTGLDSFEPYQAHYQISFFNRVIAILKKPLLFWPFLIISGFIQGLPFINIFTSPISVFGAGYVYLANLNSPK